VLVVGAGANEDAIAVAGRGERDRVDALLQASGPLGTPSQVAIGLEAIERMQQAFDALPEHYREVISLARIAGLPHVEVARRMGKTEQATRQLLGRALVQLATLMQDQKA
jgi:RNA polymerase sigma factor (sigma-70 family)